MVTVVISHWDDGAGERRQYLHRCYDALQQHLISDDNIRYIIADDGSRVPFALLGADVVTGPHNGLGASLNRALTGVHDLWMYTTDDWLLTENLDLRPAQDLIRQHGYDIVRVGPIHPNLMCWTKFEVGIGWWLDITQNGHGYIFATRPFLASPRFIWRFGPFVEGVDAYVTERIMSDQFNAQGGRAAALMLHGPWKHIGDYEVGDRPVAP